MAEASSAIVASGISRSYGAVNALSEFSIEVPTGSVFGLLGPNGSGKSTFISMVAAMDRPLQGTLTVLGQTPSIRLRGRIGTVFQENAQDPLMTVRETLSLAGRLFGLGGQRLRSRTADLLAAFGLADRETSPVSALSGGMRRRLEMARALLHDPDLLLLDEPTTGVDADERRALWGALIGGKRGTRTILLATNDLAEADTVCDLVAFVRDGRVVVSGTPAELKRGLRQEVVRADWETPGAAQLTEVEGWPGTGPVTRNNGLVHITCDDASALVPRLFALAPGAIRSVSIQASSLEDAYFQHVGRRERMLAEAVS